MQTSHLALPHSLALLSTPFRTLHADTNNDSDDDDVMFIEAPKPAAVAASTGAGAGVTGAGAVGDDNDSDGEIEVTGQAGTTAARDMPHPRSMCAKNPFTTATPEQKENDTCDQCYCYVCDKLIKECKSWPV